MTMESVPVLVLERGWKTRVVSRSCAIRVINSESYRADIVRRLMKRSAFAVPQSGQLDHLPIRPSGRGGLSKYRVFSADLSNATDLLNREVLEDIANVLGVPPGLVTGGTIKFNGVSRDMLCGTLMGIPLSFPFLNLVHLYVCDRIGATRDSYYVCGDDLIALWSEELIHRYTKFLVKLTGMVPNRSKSFTSSSRGIFCERAYHLAPDGLRVNRKFLSVKAVTPMGEPSLPKGPEAQPGLPWDLSPLLYLQTHYGRLGHSRVEFVQKRILSSYVGKVMRLAKKHGISMYLPIQWGGAGLFPPKERWRFSRKERRAVSALCAGDETASRRMKAVRYELVKPSKPREANASVVTSNERAAQRVRSVFDKIICTAQGEGVPEELDKLLVQIRSFSEDIASAEDWESPEDVTMRTWFRTLSKISAEVPAGIADVTIRSYSDILGIVLKPDTSKFRPDNVAIAAARLLPQKGGAAPRSVPSGPRRLRSLLSG